MDLHLYDWLDNGYLNTSQHLHDAKIWQDVILCQLLPSDSIDYSHDLTVSTDRAVDADSLSISVNRIEKRSQPSCSGMGTGHGQGHPVIVGEWCMSTGSKVRVGQEFVDATIESFSGGEEGNYPSTSIVYHHE